MYTKKLIGICLVIATLLLIMPVITDTSLAASDDILYTHNALNFSITLPVDWAGRYGIEETENGIFFVNLRNEQAGYGGRLFGIHLYNEAQSELFYQGYEVLMVIEGKHYYYSTPTDVQWLYYDEFLSREYWDMANRIESIVTTFYPGVTTQPNESLFAPTLNEMAYSSVFTEVRNYIRFESIIGGNSYPTNDITEYSYTFFDIDNNGVDELIFTSDGGGAHIYTLSGGNSVFLAYWAGYRDVFDGINTRGYMVGGGSSSAWENLDRYVRVAADGKSCEITYVEYVYSDDGSLSCTIINPDGTKTPLSPEACEAYVNANLDAPFVELTGWKTLTDMSGKIIARPTASTVLVNGKNVAFDAYNISDNNYFKLRDLAYILNGTAKQFGVGWDGINNAISLTSGQSYAAVGGEMQGKGSGDKRVVPTNSKIYLDGKEVQFTAYNIEDNNYFKLRDVGAAFNFGVDWDGANNTIVIDTSKPYTP